MPFSKNLLPEFDEEMKNTESCSSACPIMRSISSRIPNR